MLVTNRGLSDRALMSSRICGGGMTTLGLAACSGGVELMDPGGPWLLGLAPVGLALLAIGVATARFASTLTRHAEEYGWDVLPLLGIKTRPIVVALTCIAWGIGALTYAGGELI